MLGCFELIKELKEKKKENVENDETMQKGMPPPPLLPQHEEPCIGKGKK